MLFCLLPAVIYRRKTEGIKEESKKKTAVCLSWLLIYFLLSMISCAFNINIISETSNWLFLVLFPLLIMAGFRKENVIKTLKETGLKRFNNKTVLRILLVCILYMGCIILVFSLREDTPDILTIALKMSVKFPVFFFLMVITAAFTEEFFFRGMIQRLLMDSLKRPYTAILPYHFFFGLYHFPFAFYLWDETAGSAVDSLKTILTDQAVTNAAIMALGMALSG